jgi:hypothetical protein
VLDMVPLKSMLVTPGLPSMVSFYAYCHSYFCSHFSYVSCSLLNSDFGNLGKSPSCLWFPTYPMGYKPRIFRVYSLLSPLVNIIPSLMCFQVHGSDHIALACELSFGA